MFQAGARRGRLRLAGSGAACSQAGMPSSACSLPDTPDIAPR
jgi:hypothetical protein